MRLIDADELRNELTSICSDKVNDYNKAVKAFIEFIDNAPTVTIKEWKEEMPIYIKDAMLEALRPQEANDCIPVKDLINFIRTCREELFEKTKDYHPREFEIRDSMLTNFEKLVRLASSKYKADMRKEAENDS